VVAVAAAAVRADLDVQADDDVEAAVVVHEVLLDAWEGFVALHHYFGAGRAPDGSIAYFVGD
jgi:hypothetical protein